MRIDLTVVDNEGHQAAIYRVINYRFGCRACPVDNNQLAELLSEVACIVKVSDDSQCVFIGCAVTANSAIR